MNNDRSEVEKDTRYSVGVFFELFPGKEAIEKGLRLREGGRLHSLWSD
jgi:hypothetical protein